MMAERRFAWPEGDIGKEQIGMARLCVDMMRTTPQWALSRANRSLLKSEVPVLCAYGHVLYFTLSHLIEWTMTRASCILLSIEFKSCKIALHKDFSYQ